MRDISKKETQWRGLSVLLSIGLVLLGLYLLSRAYPPAKATFVPRELLRLRGALVLLIVAWCGRYVLMPGSRWPKLWLGYLPAAVAIAATRWPLWDSQYCLVFFRETMLAAVYFWALEPLIALFRKVSAADLFSPVSRETAKAETRADASASCFLTTLLLGVSLYLLSVDYIFDYFLYSLSASLAVFAMYIAPLAVLRHRVCKVLQADLQEVARLETEALGAREPSSKRKLLICADLSRRVVERATHLGITGGDWLYPLGSSCLLLIAAIISRW